MKYNYAMFEWLSSMSTLDELLPQIEQNQTNNEENSYNDKNEPIEDKICIADREECKINNNNVIMIEDDDDKNRIIFAEDNYVDMEQ